MGKTVNEKIRALNDAGYSWIRTIRQTLRVAGKFQNEIPYYRPFGHNHMITGRLTTRGLIPESSMI
jgi:hypothetical protein